MGYQNKRSVFVCVVEFVFLLRKSSEQKPGCLGMFTMKCQDPENCYIQPVCNMEVDFNPETIGRFPRILVEKNGVRSQNIKKNLCIQRYPQKTWTSKEIGHGFCNIWGVPKIGVPQNGWFIMENLIKLDHWMIWGENPLFSETSIFCCPKKISWPKPSLPSPKPNVAFRRPISRVTLRTVNASLD